MKMTSYSLFLRRHRVKIATAIALFGVHRMSFALAGLDKATTAATDIQTGLFALLAVAALIYLLWLAGNAFTDKKTWGDFGWGAIYVSCAGAAISLGTWAWTLLA